MSKCPKKWINDHQINDVSNTFTSVKETSSLGDLFLFRESEKSLETTTGGFLFRIRFYEFEDDPDLCRNTT